MSCDNLIEDINDINSERPLEFCFLCDCATGRAGAGEDSMYTEDELGPFCERCWDKIGKSHDNLLSKPSPMKFEWIYERNSIWSCIWQSYILIVKPDDEDRWNIDITIDGKFLNDILAGGFVDLRDAKHYCQMAAVYHRWEKEQ